MRRLHGNVAFAHSGLVVMFASSTGTAMACPCTTPPVTMFWELEIASSVPHQEAIADATGAPREGGCPPWIVLGVKGHRGARGVRAA
jgi:hypothetical protein